MWDDAWAYDLATSSFGEDLPYWNGLIRQFRPKRVLELGCGTGRISFALATAGLAIHPNFKLVALDSSQVFLDRARARMISGHPGSASALRFIEGDMTKFTLHEQFDLIVVGYNNLAYLADSDQRESCFRAIRKHLAEGGRLAIDLHVPNLTLLAEAQREIFPAVRHELEWVNPAPGVSRFVSLYKTTSYDSATQTEETTHYWEIYHTDGRHQHMVKELTWHHYFPCELRALLQAHGLAPVAEYGSYELAPFSAASPQYLWVMATA